MPMMAAHGEELYVNNVGCPSATSMLQTTSITKKLGASGRQHSTAVSHRYVAAVAAAEDSIEEAAICPMITDCVWAAMDTYSEPAGGEYAEKLKSAFWKLEASWLALNETTPEALRASTVGYGLLNDTDYDGLWVKDGSCILAFRGSDSQIDVAIFPLGSGEGMTVPDGYQAYGTKPGAPNGVQWSDVNFHGLQVHLGVKVELEALLTKMQANDGFATIKEKCPSGLTLTGHSLGGGTSQLLATLLNKKEDPLGAGLTVDHLYGFGPMPFVKDTAAVNDKSSDGCFAGGMYANAPSKTDDGIPEVDLVWQMLTMESLNYKHVKTSHHLMVSPTDSLVTPCGEDPPYPYTGKTVKKTPMMAAHGEELYVNNVGCPSATSMLQTTSITKKP